MLQDSKAFSSFSVDDLARAKAFYAETLGLAVREEMDGLVLDPAGGATVFVYPKENHSPASFTVLNFPVDDIEPAADGLAAAGVSFEQYPDLGTDERGIASMEQGPRIAWFKDPAGNILSVLQE